MTLAADIIMIVWGPFVLLLFAGLPPRRAVIVGFLGAWLFLPMTSYTLPGMPDYTKVSATTVWVMLGAAIFDAQRLLRFRFRWFDLPVLLWCVCPLASSFANGLGLYDGVSGVLGKVFTWGLPYVIGRIYFSDQESLRELAMAIFIGGLLYVPFCWFEIRMSPHLHKMLYGYHQHGFGQTVRYGGYRPMVFMQHGLMVGSWMAAASLVGFWLWYTGAVKRLKGVPIGWPLAILMVTTVLCKSFGALLLLAVGLASLMLTRVFQNGVLIGLLLAVPPVYIASRTFGMWDGSHAVEGARELGGEERAGSLEFRMENENMLIGWALQRPLLGWGGWGRNRVHDDYGRDMTITDGFWIIVLGKYGVLGMLSAFSVILVPPLRIWLRWDGKRWGQPSLAPPAALAMVLILFSIDCLPNSMVNPIFILCLGSLAFVPDVAYAETMKAYATATERAESSQLVKRRLWPVSHKAP